MSSSRGRKQLNRKDFHVKVDPKTPPILNQKAHTLGFVYGKGGATGELLDAIASEKLVLVPQDEWQKLKKLVTSFKEIQLQ